VDRLRYVGVDAATGKHAFVSAAPGGLLEAWADMATLESAVALHALVSAVQESGTASEAELSAFVSPLVATLRDLIEVTARTMA
jgi:hypothetical protein